MFLENWTIRRGLVGENQYVEMMAQEDFDRDLD